MLFDKSWLLQGLLLFLIIILFPVNDVQAACGDIIYQQDFGDGVPVEEIEPIIDCDNPFNADIPDPFLYELTLNNQSVASGSAVVMVEGEQVVANFNINKPPGFSFNPFRLFRKDGGDYVEVSRSGNVRSGSVVLEGLTEGDYVAILTHEEPPIFSQKEDDFKGWLRNLFLPTRALAFYSDFVEVVAIPFTVEFEVEEPAGASSVLFLPGIMGSRLYEEGDECGSGVAERELWFSASSCDQLRLKTSFLGESENKIFTTVDQSSIVSTVLTLNLYKSFLEYLSELEENEIIKNFVALPYDWRLMLDDIIHSSEIEDRVTGGEVDNIQEGLLYQTISNLADHSLSGKVSIVAHSNGGLVSKHFLNSLEKKSDPLLSKIDHLFLVGVPQSGTPESIISLLHGSKLGGGFVIDQVTGREMVNQMPFIHHLLPSDGYFKSDLAADFPVISFQEGEITGQWREKFGSSIQNVDDLHNFLSKNSARSKPAREDLLQPEVTDPFLLNYATVAHTIQSDWEPVGDLKVHQLSGDGISTTVGLSYFTDYECVSRSLFSGFVCEEYAPKLGYRITKVDSGDGTVALPSSAFMNADDKVSVMTVNLLKYNGENLFNRVHRDILEIEDVRVYISNIIKNETIADYRYLDEGVSLSLEGRKITFQLHSPLDMKVIAGGKELSSSAQEIKNGVYERFGEVQYISIPESIGDFELILTGLAEGSFTLEIEEWQGGVMRKRTDFVAVPSITGTKVVLEVSDDNIPSTFKIDYDGDGVVDAVVNEDGSLDVLASEIEDDVEQSVAVEEKKSSGSSSTRVNREKVPGQVAGVSTSVNSEDKLRQELAVLLTELSRLLTLLGKI